MFPYLKKNAHRRLYFIPQRIKAKMILLFIFILYINVIYFSMNIIGHNKLLFQGMVLTYLGGWYLHWRTLAWICNIFIIVPCLVCIIIHESPSWLILKGKYEQAKKSLDWIHKYQKPPGEVNIFQYKDNIKI